MVWDDEAVVEAAFMAFDKNPKLYREADDIYWKDDLDFELYGGDNKPQTLLKFVKENMNINKVYHKKSIARISDENNFD